MPRPQELLKFGELWRPYRTIASWYMWRAFERAGYKVTNKIRPPRVRKKRNAAKSVAPTTKSKSSSSSKSKLNKQIRRTPR